MSETPLSDVVADCRFAVDRLIQLRLEADAVQHKYEAQLNVVSQAWNKLLDLAIGYERGE